MKGLSIPGPGDRAAALVAVVTLGLLLTLAPDASAWGRRGFEGGGYGGGSPYQSEPQGNGGGAGHMYIYPSRGQSAQQEQRDKAQCYTWAVKQSGFDPANPQVASGPPPPSNPPQGGVFRGAAGGAALGAIGGAIGGNAGKGAAMGAAMGGLFGGMRRRRWHEQQMYQQQTYMEQQQGQLERGRRNFERAFGTCMTGRGYTVGG